MIRAASVEIEINLLGYSRYLISQGIPHRIIEESGKQIIWVNSEADADFVRHSLRDFLTDSALQQDQAEDSPVIDELQRLPLWFSAIRLFLASPVTLTLIILCLLVAVISGLGSRVDRVDFLFYPLVATDGLLPLLADLVNPLLALRTLAPMFLHFGELHLIFNMLWLWYFGKQLETIQPAWVFLALVVITAFISNTTQYLWIGYNNFGGMSGVVYGLVGYTWVIHSFMPRSSLLLNNNMFLFFVVALVLMELVAGSWIATAAHVGGLLAGLALGVVAVLIYRVLLNRQVIGRPRPGSW